MRHRPKVRLLAPPELVLGGTARLVVLVEAKRPVPVDFVDLHVERWGSVPLPPLNLGARLLGKSELSAGVTELPVRVEIVATWPPNFRGARIQVGHRATVHVSVPWWPDRREAFALRFTQAQADVGAAEPLLFSPHPAGPPAGQASFECRLDDNTFVPGGLLSGTVVLVNAEQVNYRGVTITLRSSEKIDGNNIVFSGSRYSVELPPPRGDGRLPFRMKLPKDLEPTWLGPGYDLKWFVEVRATVGFGRDVRGTVPVTVAPTGSERRDAPKEALPSVGDERVRRVWEVVAQRHGFALEGESLRARVGPVEVVVERDRIDTRLVARLSFPSLRLGLDGGRKSGFRRVFAESVDLSQTPWARGHYATGRDARQVAHVVGALAAAVAPSTETFDNAESEFQRRVAFEDLEDQALVLSCADAGSTYAPLARFAQVSRRVAAALSELRFETPLPEGHDDAAPTWLPVEKALDARLETTHLGVEGRKDGVATELRTLWDLDGDIRGLEVVVATTTPIDASRCFERRQSSWLSEPSESLPEEAGILLDRLAAEVEHVEVSPQRLRVLLAPDIAPEDALGRVDRLLRLAAALRVAVGPYR